MDGRQNERMMERVKAHFRYHTWLSKMNRGFEKMVRVKFIYSIFNTNRILYFFIKLRKYIFQETLKMQSLQSISKQKIHETTIDIYDDWSNLDEYTWKKELNKLPQLFKIELAVEAQIILLYMDRLYFLTQFEIEAAMKEKSLVERYMKTMKFYVKKAIEQNQIYYKSTKKCVI